MKIKESKLREIVQEEIKRVVSEDAQDGAYELNGKIGFISTGGSTNEDDWKFLYKDSSESEPYNKVKLRLKRPKNYKPAGYSDYLKQGGRDWD